MSRSLDFDSWVNDARKVTCSEELDRRGVRLRRAGAELVGPCPACGGTDRFSIHLRKNIFHCRRAGAGGDAIAMVEYLDGCDFLAACETLTGRPAPDGSEGQRISPEEAAAREVDRRRKQAEREAEAEKFRQWARRLGFDIWKATHPAAGTLVEDYFQRRGLGSEIPKCIRFAPALPYMDKDGAGNTVRVCVRPAMVAAIRAPDGKFGAAHVTWLDLDQDKGKAVILGPDGAPLPSKKVFGSKKAGAIRLVTGEISTLIIGEGVETTLTVRRALCETSHPLAKAHIWAGVDLGNIGGKAVESIAHPTLTRTDAAGRTRKVKVPGAEPDLSDGDALFPPEDIDQIILLGDGDSDRFTTSCTLRRAAARWAQPGRTIKIAWAPDGKDFNDIMTEGARMIDDASPFIAALVDAAEPVAEGEAHPHTPAAGEDMGGDPPGDEPPPPDGEGDGIDWDMVRRCAAEAETDIGNGRRFLHRYGDSVLAIEGLGFSVYDGRRWIQDFFNSHVRPLAHITVETIRFEPAVIEPLSKEAEAIAAGQEALTRHDELKSLSREVTPDEKSELLHLARIIEAGRNAVRAVTDRRGKRARYGKTSCNSGKIDNMLKEAAVYRSRPVSVLDSDPYALNTLNGTVRLHGVDGSKATDKIWNVRIDQHRKEDLISKLVLASYDPDAACPKFLNFLDTILPDDTVRAFMQRYLGYCLTGLTNEQVFVFLYGQGRNGKSTLVDVICRILGDYSTTVPFETLAGDDRRKGSEATPDLVRVPGARIVRASEPETGMKFRESMVKSLTSGEPILIRRMREEFVEVYPTFKLIISGNHRPDIRGGDDGIWRRVLLVPFEVQIPKELVDRDLPEKLWAERSGILNWLIAGALSYLQEGLGVPDAVRGATEEYRDQSDAYGAFLRGACTITGEDSDITTPGELYAAFKVFCEKQGFYAVGVSTFNKAIPDKAPGMGFRKAKSMGLSVYRGIHVRDEFKPSSTRD